MSRSTPQGEPHDWVTRAADDAIRHHEKTGASGPVTCSSGASPSGPVHLGNLREFLMPHFVADELRRRGVPVRHLHVWDDYDRFRKVPAGVDRVVGRAHRPAPRRRARPVGVPPVVVRPLQGAGASAHSTSSASTWRRSPRPSGTAPGSTATRCCAPFGIAPTSTPSLRGTARRSRRSRPRRRTTACRAGGRGDGRLGGERRRGRGRRRHDRRRLLPVQAVLPRLRTRHHHGHGVRRRDDRPGLHLLGRATTTAPPTSPRRTRASWCGRPTGRCAGPSSTSTSSRPAWTTRRPGSSFTVGHELVESVWDYPRPAWFGYGFVGFAGVQKMSSSAGGAPDRRGRAAGARAGDPALALRPAPAQADLRHRLRARGRAAVRRVGRAGPEGRRSREARRRRCWPTSARRRPRPPDGCRPPRSSYPSGCSSSVADVTAGSRRADQPDRRHDGPRPRLGRRSSSRGCRGRWPGPRSSCPSPTAPRCAPSRTRSRSRRCRARSGSGSRCSSRVCRASSTSSR